VKILEIIAHRGHWKEEIEKNTLQSFEKALECSYGIETDIRDYCGKLVISHDIPDDNSILLEDFLEIYNQYNRKGTLALNIKADGLQQHLLNLFEVYNVHDYFVFDMSIPEHLKYNKNGFKMFTRQSEYEEYPVLYKESQGVWLDCFEGEWYDINVIKNHVNNKKKVCIVSPELHGRDYCQLWEQIKNKLSENEKKNISLCTDLPNEAEEFFSNF